jgi:peptidoglycan-associated lipoprotein
MKKLCACLLLLLWPAVAAVAQQYGPVEVAFGYTFMHTNAPPSGCGCFSMNGGFGSVAWQLKPTFALVGEIGATHASDINPAKNDLTLTTFLFGPRFSARRKLSAGEVPRLHGLTPYAQLLFGGAHASGALSGTTSGSSNGFAFAAGGGVDLGLSHKLAWRVFQTEYLLTRIPNGVNDHENNFRLSSGLLIHF